MARPNELALIYPIYMYTHTMGYSPTDKNGTLAISKYRQTSLEEIMSLDIDTLKSINGPPMQ